MEFKTYKEYEDYINEIENPRTELEKKIDKMIIKRKKPKKFNEYEFWHKLD